MSRQAKLALAILAGAILIAALLVGLRPAPKEKPRNESAPLVRTIALEPGSGPIAILGSGTVQPREEVTIGAEVAGRLVYVHPHFREGGVIGSGAELFRIDPSDYRNRVRSAQADVAAQDVAVLQAREEAAIAQEELRRFAGRQDRDLMAETIDGNDYASRILPPRGLQDKATQASAQGQSRQGGPARLATREPQLRSARAARERAAAQLADARLSLTRTSVRAPFSGIVRSENASVGTLVQPGQELGSIVATSSYEVRVSLTENEAALIPGLLNGKGSRIPAQVFFDYGPQVYRWSAFVDRADALLDPKTRTIDVFLRVPDPLKGAVPVGENALNVGAPPLLLGSFVRAQISGGSGVSYAEIPARFVRPGNKIWVVRAGQLRILPIRILQRTDDVAYVTTDTLAQGGRLVISSLRAPVDGMRVRVEKPVKRAKPVVKAPAKAATSD